MTITMERDTAKELITFKIQHLQETIHSILNKWGEELVEDFISKARSGKLENAEMDAITIRQLLADYNRLKELLDSVISEE